MSLKHMLLQKVIVLINSQLNNVVKLIKYNAETERHKSPFIAKKQRLSSF
jgi:hypothetical protein